MQDTVIGIIAQQNQVSVNQTKAVIKLLEEGSTVPFISRYRKEATQGLDEVAVEHIRLSVLKFKELEKRKATIIETITAAGLLTTELEKKIDQCWDAAELEEQETILDTYRRALGMLPELDEESEDEFEAA